MYLLFVLGKWQIKLDFHKKKVEPLKWDGGIKYNKFKLQTHKMVTLKITAK